VYHRHICAMPAVAQNVGYHADGGGQLYQHYDIHLQYVTFTHSFLEQEF
jgi:hypothetical protein